MELYEKTSYELSRRLTQRYSTSFSLSSTLFAKSIRHHIYAVYGLVRIADEIVDTYHGEDADQLLNELESHTEHAMQHGYSPNPIVHAFALTAQKFGITHSLTRPFFASMRMDLQPQTYTAKKYSEYIYGSAEVIGLMCLRIFTNGNSTQYTELTPGARALGAAYQKVNFLRDLRDDYERLGRTYFPGVNVETMTEKQKIAIQQDIQQDFAIANHAINDVPTSARAALRMSYEYYYALFAKLKNSDLATIKSRRISVANGYKLILLVRRFLLR